MHAPTALPRWIEDLPRARPIAVYCICGFQVSGKAVSELRQRGYNARAVVGGITAWHAIGGPTVPMDVSTYERDCGAPFGSKRYQKVITPALSNARTKSTDIALTMFPPSTKRPECIGASCSASALRAPCQRRFSSRVCPSNHSVLSAMGPPWLRPCTCLYFRQ